MGLLIWNYPKRLNHIIVLRRLIVHRKGMSIDRFRHQSNYVQILKKTFDITDLQAIGAVQ